MDVIIPRRQPKWFIAILQELPLRPSFCPEVA
jgi:hypothetical protein